MTDSKIPTLCLNMIVKNESLIIKRLLDSVINIIDTYCICDTGSTDNTIEIITQYFTEKNIKGKIVQEPFKNFEYNRNFGLEACKGLSDYILLLDADMILQIKNFQKSLLTNSNIFYILQGNDSFYYQNIRIIKNNGKYKYKGVTHEYLDYGNENCLRLDKSTIFILDLGDGGSKKNKFERDITLLLDGLKNEPNNPRYYFYLANSYFNMNDYENAIENYKKRINFGGWKEEVWYSSYRIGLSYYALKDFSNAILYWLECYNIHPDRLENIYQIIKHYRLNSKYRLCMEFYKIAKNVLDKKYDRDTYLFLENDVYTWKIYYEYTIFSAYCDIKNINSEIVRIFNISNSKNEIFNILSNMKFYKQILKKKDIINFDNKIIENGINFNSSSSCLIKNKDKTYLMNIRYVNYYIKNDGSYIMTEKEIPNSLNKFVHLDQYFKTIDQYIIDESNKKDNKESIEDIKIYNYKDKNLFLGTCYLYYKQTKYINILSGNYNYKDKKIDNLLYLKQNFKKTDCEKNWVFVEYKNDLHIIYEWYPLTICKLEMDNLIIRDLIKMPLLFSLCRGSTCGYIYNNCEIWFVQHIVSYENPRHYYHIISIFDLNMRLIRYSSPFKFEGEPIEYCLSILVEDDRVIINYSTWDRTTRIGIYDKKYIDSLLIY